MAKKEKDAGKKDKKGKGKGKDEPQGASIASHPRAKTSIRRAKGWAGLAGFAIATYVSLGASVPLFQTGLRALGAGLVGYMLAWWAGVLVWRQLILAEQHAAYEIIERRRNEEAETSSGEQPHAKAQPTA
jgi:hypothetical protein